MANYRPSGGSFPNNYLGRVDNRSSSSVYYFDCSCAYICEYRSHLHLFYERLVMENIIAYCIMILAVVIFVGVIFYSWNKFKQTRKLEADREEASRKAWLQKMEERSRVAVPDSMKRYVNELDKDGSKTNIKAVDKSIEVPPRGKETTVKYSSATAGAPSKPAPSASMNRYSEALDRKWSTDQPTKRYDDSSDDGSFLTGMIVGTALNTIMSGSGRESSDTERSVGVTKSESSWGWDDSSSRKAVEDTFSSSSWSSSDSSSDSWSSSDSSPSSDW